MLGILPEAAVLSPAQSPVLLTAGDTRDLREDELMLEAGSPRGCGSSFLLVWSRIGPGEKGAPRPEEEQKGPLLGLQKVEIEV